MDGGASRGDVAGCGARYSRVDSKSFFNDTVEVAQVLRLLMGWHLILWEACQRGVDFLMELGQDFCVFHDAPDNPRQRGGRSMRSGEDEVCCFRVQRV